MVAVVSNIAHYSHTARALSRAGRLAAFVAPWLLLDNEPSPWWLPSLYRRKFESRRYKGIQRSAVHRCYSPELIRKAAGQIGCARYFETDSLFDLLAKRRLQSVDGWRTVHFVYGTGLACARLARSRGATVVCDARHEHVLFVESLMQAEGQRLGLPVPVQSRRYTERMQSQLDASDHLVVPSEYAKRTFVPYGFARERIHVVPYGADLARFSVKPKKPGKRLQLLFVGYLSLRKGILHLLDAIARLKTGAVELTCVGQIEPTISRLIERHSVKFVHYPTIPNGDLPGLYQAADLMVLPSLADSYGLVVLEALATGTPVLTTTSTGAAELVSHGVNGFIVAPGSADQLACAIAQFLDDATLAASMAREAHIVPSRLSWDRYEADIEAIYTTGFGASCELNRSLAC